MQIVLVLSVLVVATSALPPYIALLGRSDTLTPSGAYESKYETEHGIKSEESGSLIPSDDGKGMTLVKTGSFTYQTPDGQTFTTTYVADKNGYRALGDHHPKSVVAVPVSFI